MQISAYTLRCTYVCHTCNKSCSLLDAAVREPQCPNNSWSAPTASVFNDVHTLLYNVVHAKEFGPSSLGPHLEANARKAIQSTKLDSVVILGHSFGVQTAIAMVSGGQYTPFAELHA